MEFVIGALGAAAFFRFRGMRRGGWRGGRRGFRQTFILNRLSEALDASPAQEKVMRQVMEEIEGVTEGFRDEWEKTRHAASRATSGETFNAEELREAWTRHDQVIAQMRVAMVEGLRKLHEALEPSQRRQLADLIEGGFRQQWGRHGRFGRFGHFGHHHYGRGGFYGRDRGGRDSYEA